MPRVERHIPRLTGERQAGDDGVGRCVDDAQRLRGDRESRSRALAVAAASAASEDDAGRDGPGRENCRHGADCEGAASPAARDQLAAQSGLAGCGQLTAAPEALARRLRKRLGDDRVEALGNARPHIARARRRLVHVRVDGRDLPLALERSLPGEALEEHAPE